ncbi:MAG: hypothetical protein Q8Q30_01900 [Candidatus Woesebacteria bacterium]|nr:hypothetical protein [Candidatus Woesebacteria bacterium]
MTIQIEFDTRSLLKDLKDPKYIYEIKENKQSLFIIRKPKSNKGRPSFLTTPKKIKISPEAVGLIVGEGYMGSHFVFANSNEKAIDEILFFLKQFKMPLKFYLEISVKNQPDEFVKICKKFWQEHLHLALDRIRLRKEFNSEVQYGTLHINANSIILANLLKKVIEVSKNKAENNKAIATSYLIGILAAEGNINIKKKTNCVYMVRISASKKKERNHYKKCLKKVGIKIFCKDMPTISKKEGIKRGWKTKFGRAGAVIISKWDNFIKILDLNLLKLSKDKMDKFSIHILQNKFTKQFLDISPFIGKEFRIKTLQNHLNLSSRHVCRLLTLFKKGYVNRRKKKNFYLYKLNNNYIRIYNKLISTKNQIGFV